MDYTIEGCPGVFFVIRPKGIRTPIAFGGITDEGEIYGLYVDPSWRRQKLGSDMVKFLEGYSKVKTVYAHTHCENEAGKGILVSLGYSMSGSLDFEGERYLRYDKGVV